MLCKTLFTIVLITPLALSAPLHQRGLTEVKKIAVLENAQDPHTISPGAEMTKVAQGWEEAPRLMMAAQRFLAQDRQIVENSKLYLDFLDRENWHYLISFVQNLTCEHLRPTDISAISALSQSFEPVYDVVKGPSPPITTAISLEDKDITVIKGPAKGIAVASWVFDIAICCWLLSVLDSFRNKGQTTIAPNDPIKYDANLLILRPLYFDDTHHTTLNEAVELLAQGKISVLKAKPIIRGKLYLTMLLTQEVIPVQACSGHTSCSTPLLLLAQVRVYDWGFTSRF
jgi:hypothetical protein